MAHPLAAHAVAGMSAPRVRRSDRAVPIASHSALTAVPELCESLRSLLLNAWRNAPHLTERESMPMRNLSRHGEWRFPSVPVLMETLAAIKSPNVWDAIAVWAMRAKATLYGASRLTVLEAWQRENDAQARFDNAIAPVLASPSVATIDTAIAAAESQLVASNAVLDALLAKRQEITRPLGVRAEWGR